MNIFGEIFVQMLEEATKKPKHDACYGKAKRKFKKFPSLYAGAYMAKCRKGKIK
jgi:hypothetical protein